MNPLSIIWNVSPELFKIGSVSIRWYGILFAMAFVVSYLLMKKIFQKAGVGAYFLDKLTLYMFLGVLIGARLGHCIFYEPAYYFSHPIEMFLPINSDGQFIGYQGLASHGAAIGILIASWLYCRKTRIPFLWVIDRLVLAVCFAGASIRLGNLMNSEIYGTPTSLPWGFVFVRDGQSLPCHPTQLYEALAYIALGLALYFYSIRKIRKNTPPAQGEVFGIFLIGLFLARFLIEFLKNPQEIWEQTLPLDMGQWLSLPFIAIGVVILILSHKHQLGSPLDIKKLRQKEDKKKQ
jgi:prolipoprotein diacylglyceryl transferase